MLSDHFTTGNEPTPSSLCREVFPRRSQRAPDRRATFSAVERLPSSAARPHGPPGCGQRAVRGRGQLAAVARPHLFADDERRRLRRRVSAFRPSDEVAWNRTGGLFGGACGNTTFFRATLRGCGWTMFSETIRLERATRTGHCRPVFRTINDALRTAKFRPRAAVRFLRHRGAGDDRRGSPIRCGITGRSPNPAGNGRVITTFRPDECHGSGTCDFIANVRLPRGADREDCACWDGYLAALKKREASFVNTARPRPITASDRGDGESIAAACAGIVRARNRRPAHAAEAELFRAQMLNRNGTHVLRRWHGHAAANAGAGATTTMRCCGDRPRQRRGFSDSTNFTTALKRSGICSRAARFHSYSLTLDESTYSRELAPTGGTLPLPAAGPAWWFHDAPDACCVTGAARPRRPDFTIQRDSRRHRRAFF